MTNFRITITETYTNTFEVEADDAQSARDAAEDMAVERSFPSNRRESCERTIQAEEH